eukprot:jgi/Mesen1/2810/ME000172S01960
MKVVALVSGGKDSCYSMMECLRHGHEIVALANLFPEDDDVDELDSFMYQTVGHQLVAAYAQCMGLPLFRRRIKGTPRQQGLRYAATAGDEVEDLEALLRAVRSAHPAVEAVCSGAIASDYQRLRVENVCARLGLVSLAFLWKRPQGRLLRDMVAAMGLDPHKHLGKDLAALQPHLIKLARLHGSNICGEGGEYESLTLDCPLFKNARIVLDKFDVVLHSPGSIASVGVLHPTAFHLEAKAGRQLFEASTPAGSAPGAPLLPRPGDGAGQVEGQGTTTIGSEAAAHAGADVNGAGDARGGAALIPDADIIDVPDVPDTDAADGLSEPPPATRPAHSQGAGGVAGAQEALEFDGSREPTGSSDGLDVTVGIQRHGYVSVGCRRTPGSTPLADVGSELAVVLAAIKQRLAAQGLSWPHVLYVHLYVNNMTQFGAANKAYMEAITEADCVRGVPSRSTVEVPLGGVGLGHVMADVLAARDESKKVLHVQSISAWAPSCIGPYSQHMGLLHMAGQLGLDPATMSLVEGEGAAQTAQRQTARALRSCEAVARAFGTSAANCAVALTVYCAVSGEGPAAWSAVEAEVERFLDSRGRAALLRSPRKSEGSKIEESERRVPPGVSAMAGLQISGGAGGAEEREGRSLLSEERQGDSEEEEEEEEEEEAVQGAGMRPLIHYVVVPGLPKGALVEIASVIYVPAPGAATSYSSSSSDSEDDGGTSSGGGLAAGNVEVAGEGHQNKGGTGDGRVSEEGGGNGGDLQHGGEGGGTGRRGGGGRVVVIGARNGPTGARLGGRGRKARREERRASATWQQGLRRVVPEGPPLGQARGARGSTDGKHPTSGPEEGAARNARLAAGGALSWTEGLHCESLQVLGRFCRAHASADVDLAPPLPAGSDSCRLGGDGGDKGGESGNGADGSRRVAECVGFLASALQEAGLHWRDVAVLRVYYVPQRVDGSRLQALLASILAQQARDIQGYGRWGTGTGTGSGTEMGGVFLLAPQAPQAEDDLDGDGEEDGNRGRLEGPVVETGEEGGLSSTSIDRRNEHSKDADTSFSLAPLFIPVLGVGPSSSARATVAFELTAIGEKCPQ